MTIAARTRAGCRWRIQPPSGRETTPRTSVREPIAPAASLERADSRSSRVTTQFAITTLSPNEAAKTTASRRSALSRARASSGVRSDAPRGTCAGRGAARQHRGRGRGDRDRRHVRRAPAERGLERRDDGQRDPAARRGEAAVEALRERRSPRRADEVAAADEPERGADAEKRAGADRERRLRRDRREDVADRHHGEAGGADARRAEPVAQAPRGQLHEQVGEEEHRGEQPDHTQRGAVRGGEVIRDRARVGDVPARREADGAPAGDGSPAHARRAREMIDVVSAHRHGRTSAPSRSSLAPWAAAKRRIAASSVPDMPAYRAPCVLAMLASRAPGASNELREGALERVDAVLLGLLAGVLFGA